MDYQAFLKRKRVEDQPTGIDFTAELNPSLFDFQSAIVKWALRRGRAAIFADCGLGKTLMQLEWANRIPGRKLIVAPLAVGRQTEREGLRFGIGCRYMREDDGQQPVVITNYEMLHRFSAHDFNGIVLDESSILKSYTGATRNEIISNWGRVPFRLAATATPAPNDYMELGNHAEFLGVMSRTEMLSMFFIHDGGETQKWRLKGHAESEFWKWMCSWSVMLRKPSDIGFSDADFILPPLKIHNVIVEDTEVEREMLFAMEASTLEKRLAARRRTVSARVKATAAMVNASSEPWVIWCNLNSESEALAAAIPDAVEVSGAHDLETKEDRMLGFTAGKYRALVSKPTIAGHGMNWQHCAKQAFVGLSDSYEQFYQAVRRCWRFGQKRPVDAYVVTANTEGAVTANIRRKEADAEKMAAEMVKHMADISSKEIRHASRAVTHYRPAKGIKLPKFMEAA